MVRSVSSARVSSLRPRRPRPAPPAGTRRSRRERSACTRRRSNIRRSRLNPMTYSRCCQRPSSPRRLATLVLPETAPTDRVGERLRPAARRVGLEDGVAVDQDQHVVAGGARSRCSAPRACRRWPAGSAARRAGRGAAPCRRWRRSSRRRRRSSRGPGSRWPTSDRTVARDVAPRCTPGTITRDRRQLRSAGSGAPVTRRACRRASTTSSRVRRTASTASR